ncbi:MAG TPA: hypothetical protein VLS85_08620 [Hanamia sp.]|nr:hypothetical protein [Hanamia sp.]
MKSIFLVTALFLVQSAFCQSTKTKAAVNNTTKTPSNQNTPPHRNLNLPVIYTFIGNGNWSDVNNWDANGIPPVDITPGSEIRINSSITGAKCVLDVPYEVPNTTNTIKLTVYTGNKLVVPDLIVR